MADQFQIFVADESRFDTIEELWCRLRRIMTSTPDIVIETVDEMTGRLSHHRTFYLMGRMRGFDAIRDQLWAAKREGIGTIPKMSVEGYLVRSVHEGEYPDSWDYRIDGYFANDVEHVSYDEGLKHIARCVRVDTIDEIWERVKNIITEKPRTTRAQRTEGIFSKPNENYEFYVAGVLDAIDEFRDDLLFARDTRCIAEVGETDLDGSSKFSEPLDNDWDERIKRYRRQWSDELSRKEEDSIEEHEQIDRELYGEEAE